MAYAIRTTHYAPEVPPLQAWMWRLTEEHAVLYPNDRATLNAVLAYPRFPHQNTDRAVTYTGKNGRALSFNGSSSMVTVPDSASLDLSTALTIEAWVKPSTVNGSWRTVVLKEQSANLTYALYAADGASRPSGHVWAGRDAATTMMTNTNKGSV